MEQRDFWEAGMQQIFSPTTSRFLGLGGFLRGKSRQTWGPKK